MRKQITLALRADDAEAYLRQAAEDAAKFGAWVDYIGPRTWHGPRWGDRAAAKKEWQALFLKAKRIVEAFGVEYEQTSEEETLTVDFPHVGGKTKVVGGLLRVTTGSAPDYKDPRPAYRRGVHEEACRQAADRVVRRWRAMLEEVAAA